MVGRPSLASRPLAGKVIEVYWPHTRVHPHAVPTGPLSGLRENKAGQAKILSLIQAFREVARAVIGTPLAEARLSAPGQLEALSRVRRFKSARRLFWVRTP